MTTTGNTRNHAMMRIAIVAIVGAVLAMTLYFNGDAGNRHVARISTATKHSMQTPALVTPDYLNLTRFMDTTPPDESVVSDVSINTPQSQETRFAFPDGIFVPRHFYIDNTDPETKAYLHSRQFTKTMENPSRRGIRFPPDIRGAPGTPGSLPEQAKPIN